MIFCGKVSSGPCHTIWLLCLFVLALSNRPAPSQQAAQVAPPPANSRPPRATLLPPQPTPPPRPLTLADLEQLALRHNPTIAAAEGLVVQRRGIYRQETIYPNPTIGYVRTDADQPGHTGTAGIFFSQEIVTAGKRRIVGRAATAEIAWRQWQLQAQRIRVLNDVRIRYFDLLGAHQAVLIGADMERQALELVRIAKAMAQAKQAARPDILQAELHLQAVQTSLQDAKYRRQEAWEHLENVIGVSGLPRVLPNDTPEQEVPRLDKQQALQQLLAISPVLKAQMSLVEAAQHDLDLAKAQAIPNVTVQVVAQRDHVQKYSSVSALLAMPLPVFNRNQGNILTATGLLAQQKKEYERIQLAMKDQFTEVFTRYLSSQNQVNRLGREFLPRAKENLELTTKGYQLKQLDLRHVLSARQTYFQTRLAYNDALIALHKTVVEIRGLGLTGGLNPTEIGTALQVQPGLRGRSRSLLLQQFQQQGGGSGLLPGALQAGPR